MERQTDTHLFVGQPLRTSVVSTVLRVVIRFSRKMQTAVETRGIYIVTQTTPYKIRTKFESVIIQILSHQFVGLQNSMLYTHSTAGYLPRHRELSINLVI